MAHDPPPDERVETIRLESQVLFADDSLPGSLTIEGVVLEEWRGSEIYVPAGAPLHVMLARPRDAASADMAGSMCERWAADLVPVTVTFDEERGRVRLEHGRSLLLLEVRQALVEGLAIR